MNNILPMISALPCLNLFVGPATAWHTTGSRPHLLAARMTSRPSRPISKSGLPSMMVTRAPTFVITVVAATSISPLYNIPFVTSV